MSIGVSGQVVYTFVLSNHQYYDVVDYKVKQNFAALNHPHIAQLDKSASARDKVAGSNPVVSKVFFVKF